MSGPTCPACGVTVLAGYTRCPKCKAPLPAYGGGTRAALGAGGTAVEDNKFPVVPLAIVGLLVAGGVIFFALRNGGDDKPATPAPGSAAVVVTLPGSTPVPATTTVAAPTAPVAQRGPSVASAVGALDAALKKQRLWSKIETLGTRVDVRSASCADPLMAPTIDSVHDTLRDAGIAQVRCLENSGRPAFTRDL